MSVWPPDFSVRGDRVAIVPLSQDHSSDLAEAAAEEGLHRIWYTTIPAPEGVAAEIDRRLGLRAKGSMQPFAILDASTGRAVGMTTFMNIDATHRRVEIGSTWYRPSAQRSGLNTECKLLLLTHAFDDLDCIAVELRTHVMNRQSRAAIERLGAKLDGILRSHMRTPNGALRDTAVYSIIACEWPAVRANLEWLLVKPR